MTKVKTNVLVVGLGRFGTALATELFEAGQEVIVLDQDESAVEAIKARTSAAYVGDASNMDTLESVGAADVDVAVITFGENFEATVLAVASLSKLQTKRIVARASSPRQADVLTAVGAHRTVQLEADMGRRLASEMIAPTNEALLELAQGYQVVPWEASGPLVGTEIGAASLYERYRILVIGLARKGDVGDQARPRVRFPRSDYVIKEGDTLMLVGEDKDLNAFSEGLGA